MRHSYSDAEKREALRRGDPIFCMGLTFYPITMAHYETFLQCKDALTVRQSTFPVRYLSLDFLSAVFAFEIDQIKCGERVGLTERIFRFFALSLGVTLDETLFGSLTSVCEVNGLMVPSCITVKQNGNTVTLSPFTFSTVIRPLLAEQNGLLLPTESDNADLVQAFEEKKRISEKGAGLKPDFGDLIASVSYLSGVRERDICDWTVKEFDARKRAIDRDKRYTMYSTAELSGMVSFKNGNPAPSWCFDLLDESLGTVKTQDLEKTLTSSN